MLLSSLTLSSIHPKAPISNTTNYHSPNPPPNSPKKKKKSPNGKTLYSPPRKGKRTKNLGIKRERRGEISPSYPDDARMFPGCSGEKKTGNGEGTGGP
ncbi:hypothetical protein JTE90_025025 [Oedothorax gibbosus]|uniref:Uncharacterized protein n=1 Tax=Oedothorax gibbosus TaxID=931172 RepID=A0AAV6U5Z2_9ARAC|nr:hypothetical protein JTE90_025025 [Oedothorax gibbosus]